MTNVAGGPLRVGPTLGMRVIIGIPKPLTRRAMNHAMEALVRINQDWMRANPSAPRLYQSGVRYGVEPPGYELWDPYALLLARGIGDCDDLATTRAAELREYEGDSGARADCYPSRIDEQGRRTWHAIVVRGDGTVEDPSARLGMRTHTGHRADGSVWADVVDEHEHLEGDNAFVQPPRASRRRQREEVRMGIRWEVRHQPDGSWTGCVWFDDCEGARHAVQVTRAPSPGDAAQGAFSKADEACGALEAAGFDFGSMIPGLLSTAADLTRTFTGGGRSPQVPQGYPPQLAQLAQTSMLRQPPQYGAPPPQWGAPPPQWGPPPYGAPPPYYGKG